MGMIKKALEELSYRLGHDGFITPEVLDHAERFPDDFSAAARRMRTRLDLPPVAASDGQMANFRRVWLGIEVRKPDEPPETPPRWPVFIVTTWQTAYVVYLDERDGPGDYDLGVPIRYRAGSLDELHEQLLAASRRTS
jgi:hypothetical protein